MTFPLPLRDFRFLSNAEIQTLDYLSISDNASTGYILEVDLTYPPHLHDLHNDYPLAVERLTVTPDMLSPRSKFIAERLGRKPTSCEKLVPNLMDKQHYVVHYRNLQLYCSLGMIVTQRS